MLAIGTRVVAAFGWGEGEIVETRPEKSEGIRIHGVRKGTRLKRYVVKRDDGKIGYFALDQVEAA